MHLLCIRVVRYAFVYLFAIILVGFNPISRKQIYSCKDNNN